MNQPVLNHPERRRRFQKKMNQIEGDLVKFSRYHPLRAGLAGLFLLFVLLTLIPSLARATIIDILLVYDTSATTWVSANGGMEAFSLDAVSRMNQAMQNSDVDATFRLVHAMSASYTTTSSLSTDLSNLQQGSGNLAAVHTARNEYGADLVAMLVDTGSAYGSVGIGYLLTAWSGQPSSAFTVNAIRSVAQSHTLTHEVGHNMGAHHSKHQTASPGPNQWLDNQYSAGWYFTGTNSVKYHTIMAYNFDGHGNFYQSAPLFSTPLKTWQGTVAGHAADGDNARILRETKDVIANYRPSVPTTTSLSVNSSGATSVSITSNPPSYGGTTSYTKTNITSGTSITLTAPATSESMSFSSWTGCDSTNQSARTCTVNMTGNKTVTANYSTDNTRIIRLTGDMTFGNVTVNQSTTRTLTIHNDGNSSLTVNSISYPIGFSGAWSGSIPAGGSSNVTVTFSPATAQVYSGTITVNSDRTSGTHTTACSGTGVQPPANLGTCLDNTSLIWTTGGNANWSCQSSVAHHGGSAAQSGSISHNQQTWLETTVTGPGTLRFHWRVSSEANYDWLSFYLGSTRQDRISGTVNWQEKSYDIPSGTHTLKWEYSKDGSLDSGTDAGWVDYVSYSTLQYIVSATTGSGGTVSPTSRNVGNGSTTTFTVTPQTGYSHGTVGGTCPVGSFSGNTYTTGTITSNCSVSFSFTQSEGRPIVLPGVLMLLLDDE
ncbi:M12 family metallo-peptidase [Desulfonatronum sp. SC1]|uniref:zinc-dependent metalloprotease family protein n=1 Tax=Desulfonatronum sp. SC1 TaxID=2109626 RepID=UPI0013047E16|nr:M12 family metallo-peptidase [Desulfonatronum sp. SC1]